MSNKERGFGVLAGAAALSLTLAAPGLVLAQATDGAQSDTVMGSQQQTSNQLMDRKASELEGKKVVNTQRERLGEIESIVKDKQTNKLSAVISVGGFLGIGDKQVTIPVEQLSLNEEGDVVAAITDSEKDLQQRTAYDEQAYDEVEDEMSLAEASGAVVGAGAATDLAAFEEMDTNRDGMISREEADAAGGSLATNWQDADSNSDGQIDQSEFSAFEAQQQAPGDVTMPPPGASDSMPPRDPGMGGDVPQGTAPAPAPAPGSPDGMR